MGKFAGICRLIYGIIVSVSQILTDIFRQILIPFLSTNHPPISLVVNGHKSWWKRFQFTGITLVCMLFKRSNKANTFVRYARLAVNIDNNVIVICQSNAIPFVFLKMTIIFFVTDFLKGNTFLTQRTIKLVFTASESKKSYWNQRKSKLSLIIFSSYRLHPSSSEKS